MGETRRTALITGSGRNIGRASALALAKDGINVIVNGSSNSAACDVVADEVRALGVEALVCMGDVGKPGDLEKMVADGIRAFGRIDILVNNAAVRPNSPFLETGEDEWDRILNIDFHAARRLAKLCLPGMIDGGWGRIINFAGMNAIHGYQIAWALLVQWAAEERSDEELLDLMAFYREIGLPASLPELGMADPTDQEIDQMAEWTMVAPHLANLDRTVDPAMLAAAIRRVETLAGEETQ